MSEDHRVLKVDRNGRGDFKSLGEAALFLKGSEVPTRLVLSPSVYNESVVFECSNLTIEGAGEQPSDTVITAGHYAKELHPDGFERGTFWTATLRTDGSNITIRNLSIENSAGSGRIYGQAVALYADGNGITVEKCRLTGYQDTLFTAPFPELNKHGKNEGFGPKNDLPRIPSKQIYRNCYIEGDVDFIFGGATALFESCQIHSKGRGYVCAPCTVKELEYGYLFLDCSFTSDSSKKEVYLGRPWRPYGAAAFIGCSLGQHIKSELFDDWEDISNRTTSRFIVSSDIKAWTDISPDVFCRIIDKEESEKYITDFKAFLTHFL